jgi:hypothetical protein
MPMPCNELPPFWWGSIQLQSCKVLHLDFPSNTILRQFFGSQIASYWVEFKVGPPHRLCDWTIEIKDWRAARQPVAENGGVWVLTSSSSWEHVFC